MRKAFDANIPKMKPRLNSPLSSYATSIMGDEDANGAIEPMDEPLTESTQTLVDMPVVEVAPPPPPVEAPRASLPTRTKTKPVAQKRAAPAPIAAPAPAPAAQSNLAAASFAAAGDIIAERKARLEKIKRRVAEAAKTPLRTPVAPTTHSEARESAIALVHDLDVQLGRSKEIEDALREDLKAARAELARTANEAKTSLERLGHAEQQVEEKRVVLGDMLMEMNALEEERDQSVQRAQALTALDYERQQVLDDVTAQLDDARHVCETAQNEVNRLSDELEIKGSEGARLRATLSEITRERDTLSRELSEVRNERDELLEARKALEQVHVALASARSKIT